MPSQHVVITGGSSGLGAALAAAYVVRGHRVSLIARDVTRLETVADDCHRRSGMRPGCHSCDVTEGARLGEILSALDAEAPITTLFANAGMGGSSVLAGANGESRDQASRIVEVNLLGVVNTLTPIIPMMASRQSGRLAIVASIAAFTPMAEAPVYAASKAAVYSYGHGLRRLLAARGVAVTIISPGFIDTPMSRSLPYNRPFLISPERAAELIVGAVHRGRPNIVFPWQLRLATAFEGVLPPAMSDRLVAAISRYNQRPA
ncbi:MAG: SDR family NAD(P)-dependent oxidoreductase [Hyphomicrobium sp.]